jgi:hypothetical protein
MDILHVDFFIHFPHRLGKISIRPETVTPQKFYQFREFFPQYSTCTAFEYLDNVRNADIRRNLHHDMNMIVLDAYRANPPAVHLTHLTHQVFEGDGHFALEEAFPIFVNPY